MTNCKDEKEFLKNYDSSKYEKPSVTVDMLLFTIDEVKENKKKVQKKLKLLLIKRKGHPFKDCWALPGGFVGMKESLDEAAYRELKEETNISDNVYLEQLYTFGDVNRDPRMRVISSSYMALTDKDNIKKTKAGDDAKEACWFEITRETIANGLIVNLINIDENLNISIKFLFNKGTLNYEYLSDEKLAFDHSLIVFKALERLAGKVSYTDIAFNLLPDEFTLNELQSVYELLLGETLDKPNFRKKIASLVEKIDSSEEDVAHRPANKYRKR